MNGVSTTEYRAIAGNPMIAQPGPMASAEILPPEIIGVPMSADPRRTFYRLLYLFWCWRHRFLITFAVTLLVGAASLFVVPLKYTATALIMVGAREPDPLVVSQNITGQPPNRELDVEGEIRVISAPSSIRRVVQQLNLEQRPQFARSIANAEPSLLIRLRNLLSGDADPPAGKDPAGVIVNDLERSLKVERIGHSSLIQISFTAASPRFAAEVANALAKGASGDDQLLSGLTLAERVGFDLLKAWVVSPAFVPRLPSSPNSLLIILVTVVLGVGAGVTVILLSDFRASQKVLNAEQVRQQGVRALALIPDFGLPGQDRLPTAVSKQARAFADSIATLQASLLPLVPSTEPASLVLLFASALPFEGKSTTVAALAASIAKGGARVLVIDADLRAPTLHHAFGATCASGLSDCLKTDGDLDSLIQLDQATGVSLLVAGRSRSRPIDVLSSARLHAAIGRWRHSYDFILIDAPPVLAVPDTRLLVPPSDYCVFVARWGKTDWGAVNQGLLSMMDAGARIAGITISRVNVKEMEGYGFIEPMLYGYPYGRPVPNPIAERQA